MGKINPEDELEFLGIPGYTLTKKEEKRISGIIRDLKEKAAQEKAKAKAKSAPKTKKRTSSK